MTIKTKVMTAKIPFDEESEIKFNQRSWQIRILQVNDFICPLFTVFYYPEDSLALSGIVHIERGLGDVSTPRWSQKTISPGETGLQLGFIALLGKAIEAKIAERHRKLHQLI